MKQTVKVLDKNIPPEIVAVITASVYSYLGNKKLAIRIKRTSNLWTAAGRQKVMDARF